MRLNVVLLDSANTVVENKQRSISKCIGFLFAQKKIFYALCTFIINLSESGYLHIYLDHLCHLSSRAYFID